MTAPIVAINVNWVALNLNPGNETMNVECGFVADYGAAAGSIELLAHGYGGPSSHLALRMANKNVAWGGELGPSTNLIGALLQPLMGWTGMTPGPLQVYEHQIPPANIGMAGLNADATLDWEFTVTGTPPRWSAAARRTRTYSPGSNPAGPARAALGASPASTTFGSTNGCRDSSGD